MNNSDIAWLVKAKIKQYCNNVLQDHIDFRIVYGKDTADVKKKYKDYWKTFNNIIIEDVVVVQTIHWRVN